VPGGSLGILRPDDDRRGPKIGRRIGPLGVFGKARGGLLRIDGPHHRLYNAGRVRTAPALDLGFVIELSLSEQVALRIDGGRAIVFFGEDAIRGPVPPYRKVVGTTFNATPSLGLQFRF
jgi:hypothetical protein